MQHLATSPIPSLPQWGERPFGSKLQLTEARAQRIVEFIDQIKMQTPTFTQTWVSVYQVPALFILDCKDEARRNMILQSIQAPHQAEAYNGTFIALQIRGIPEKGKAQQALREIISGASTGDRVNDLLN
jgi:hypothetical protein